VQPYRKLLKPSDYYLLDQADVPSILIELGFFSNWEDRRLLQNDNYLEQLKSAIIDGLTEIL
jgi:N-acetylmuramoyl-L-alanine amidase